LKLKFHSDTNENVEKHRVRRLSVAFRTDAMSTKLIDITKQLKTFISSEAHSVLLKETNGISGTYIIEAHIQKRRTETDRFGMILLTENSGEGTNCINIVNVAVAERNRRKGLFTDFLELLEGFDYGPYLVNGSDFHIWIDKVMNPVLDEFLPKRGYARIQAGNETHYCYHKMVRFRKDSINRFTQETDVGLDVASSQVFWNQTGSYTAR
jgi:hypothetical protein